MDSCTRGWPFRHIHLCVQAMDQCGPDWARMWGYRGRHASSGRAFVYSLLPAGTGHRGWGRVGKSYQGPGSAIADVVRMGRSHRSTDGPACMGRHHRSTDGPARMGGHHRSTDGPACMGGHHRSTVCVCAEGGTCRSACMPACLCVCVCACMQACAHV